MNVQNIKSMLHESIENINDKDFLIAVKAILDRKYTTTSEPSLSAAQIQRINESKLQMSKGTFLSNEQADQLVERWLKE